MMNYMEPIVLLGVDLLYVGKQEWTFESIRVDSKGLGVKF